MIGKAQIENGVSRFSIDWQDLRALAESVLLRNEVPGISRNANRSLIREHFRIGSGYWHGYSQPELTEWVTKGFRTDSLGIEILPPMREKRRYVYREDAEEMHIDRVLSGEDNYAGEFTKRVIIPGISITVQIGVSSMTNASVLNAFNVFVCQCIQSLEASGVDCEINYEYKCNRLFSEKMNQTTETRVRVKRENESIDFGAFSPMISPAAFRSFMFAAASIHSDVSGLDTYSGLGRGADFRKGVWDITQDEKTQEIIFEMPWSPENFPKSDMQAKFQQILRLTN